MANASLAVARRGGSLCHDRRWRVPASAPLRRRAMPTYVTLVRYTEQGIRNIKESPARLEAAKKLAQSVGAEIKSFYLALGAYDIVLTVDAPNDETATKLVLTIGSLGNVRTDTLRVFDEKEFRKIIASLP
jgi:uncharacterized protein with GYD domain